MTEDQIWTQLEYRGKAIEQVLSSILVSVGAAPDQEEDGAEPADDVEMKKSKLELDDEEEEEEMINNLAALSEVELKAIGIDPEMRDRLLAGYGNDDNFDDEDFAPDPDEQDEDIEDEYAHGYPGASDISSDEEEGAGSSKRVYFEPLKTEKEQRRKKAEAERKELQRIRSLNKSQLQVKPGGGASEEEESGGSDDDITDSDEDSEEEAQGPSSKASTKAKSLLDALDDEPGSQNRAGGSRKSGRRHPTLDDDFFSIDDFNRQTEEDERREIFKQAGATDDDDDEEDLDLFNAPAGDDMDIDDGAAEDDEAGSEDDRFDPTQIRYADFFEPSADAAKAGGRGSSQKRMKGKGKGSRVGQGAKLAKQERDQALAEAAAVAADEAKELQDIQAIEMDEEEDDPTDPSSDEEPSSNRSFKVKFAPTVAIRPIKARKARGLEDVDTQISPELLKALAQVEGEDGLGEDAEDSEDDDEDEEVDDDEGDDASDSDDLDETQSFGDGEGSDEDMEDGSSEGGGAFDEDQETETARRFAGDLFADEGDDQPAANGSQGSLSAHEKRLAALQAEISRLESENVGAKEWTLTGEASSRARPKDSLLEEDLDFEQSSKSTPTITIESTETLESLIKSRILEGKFDDVIPRRAVAQVDYRPQYELSDRKSGRSLAEEYEEDYRRANGEEVEAPKGENERRLDKDREEIGTLMDQIFEKLDALSNAHFIPKAPKAKITTLSNAPTLSMEEGLPSSVGSSSQLAPQEILKLGGDATILDGEKSELTPQEKQKLYQRAKKERKKQKDGQERSQALAGLNTAAGKKVQPGAGGTKKEKEDALKKLLGNKGVSVVGKGKGDAKDNGKKRDRNDADRPSGAALKL